MLLIRFIELELDYNLPELRMHSLALLYSLTVIMFFCS